MKLFKWFKKKKKLSILEKESALLIAIGEIKYKEYLSYKETLRKKFVVVEQIRTQTDGSQWTSYNIKEDGKILWSFTNTMGDFAYFDRIWNSLESAKDFIENEIFWRSKQHILHSMDKTTEILI